MAEDRKYPEGRLVVLGVDATGMIVSAIDSHPEVVSKNLWGMNICPIKPDLPHISHPEIPESYLD